MMCEEVKSCHLNEVSLEWFEIGIDKSGLTIKNTVPPSFSTASLSLGNRISSTTTIGAFELSIFSVNLVTCHCGL